MATDQPRTPEELLERHWEQGSRFLMEQASTFDIASRLSYLHQLKEENSGLEDSVDRLITRRDRLLAARARLLALNSLSEPRREQQMQTEPSSSTDQRLPVFPVSMLSLVTPSLEVRGGPLPWIPLFPGAYRGPQLAPPSPMDRRDTEHWPPTAPLWSWSPSGEWWPGVTKFTRPGTGAGEVSSEWPESADTTTHHGAITHQG